MLPDQQGYRDKDHPEVMVSTGSVPMAAWVRLLEQGEDDLESGPINLFDRRLVT
jgi:hypothetical protein